MSAKKTYRITTARSPQEILTDARSVAAEHGGELTGDESGGNFGLFGVEGEYVFEDGELVVTIAKKPFVIPWAVVESQIRKFFA
jgi:hypothetical protein